MLEELCKIAPITRIEVIGDTKLFYRVIIASDSSGEYIDPDAARFTPTEDDDYVNVPLHKLNETVKHLQNDVDFRINCVHIFFGEVCLSAYISSKRNGFFSFGIEEEQLKYGTVQEKLLLTCTDIYNARELAQSDEYAGLIEHLMQNGGQI